MDDSFTRSDPWEDEDLVPGRFSTAALEVAKTCEPDVLVIQGSDAGGHGLQRSAGLTSLFPEVTEHWKAENLGRIPLIAAGVVTEGRGFLAALALGAGGVAMGTRFLAAEEALIPEGYQDALISGSTTTVRTGPFDKFRGPNVWLQGCDGGAMVHETYADAESGMHLDENCRLCAKALQGGLQQYPNSGSMSPKTGRLTMWAGSGVELANRVLPATELWAKLGENSMKCWKD